MNEYAGFMRNVEYEKVLSLYIPGQSVVTFDGKTNVSKKKPDFSKLPPMDKRIKREFWWDTLNITMLSKTHAMVLTRFYSIAKDSKDTNNVAYTSVLQKTKQGWKILHEHESK